MITRTKLINLALLLASFCRTLFNRISNCITLALLTRLDDPDGNVSEKRRIQREPRRKFFSSLREKREPETLSAAEHERTG